MSFLAFLRKKSLIDEDLYEIAQKKSDEESYICDVLISSGEYDEEDIAKLKSEFFELQYTDLSEFFEYAGFDYSIFEQFTAIPFQILDEIVKIAITSPTDLETKNARAVYYIASHSKIK